MKKEVTYYLAVVHNKQHTINKIKKLLASIQVLGIQGECAMHHSRRTHLINRPELRNVVHYGVQRCYYLYL